MTHNNDSMNAALRSRLMSGRQRVPDRLPETQAELSAGVQLARDELELKRALAGGNAGRIERADQNLEAAIVDAAKPAEPKQRSHRDWGGGAAGGAGGRMPPSMNEQIRAGLRNSSAVRW